MGRARLPRTGMAGPLAPYGSGFATGLARQGYTPTSVDLHVRLAAHLSAWLAGEGLDAGDLAPDVVERFFAARRAAGCTSHRTSASLKPLLGYLRGIGVSPESASRVESGPAGAVLDRYRRYLRVERCLDPVTIEGYVCRVRPFLERRVIGDELSLESLAAADVVAFVLSERPRRSRGSVKLTVTALRSLLRFLHVDGVLDEPLMRAVPTVAHWRAGEISIRGKGGRQDRLPLPADVGEAVAGYLRAGRPRGATGRCVFVRAIAPREALTPRAVTKVVIRAGGRAGLGQVAAHRLRHTAATDMLRAGASLAEIGQILSHRHLSTTGIYAKVDREPLRELARPWPGGAA